MINRAKLQHILEYAKQQRHIGLHCKVPAEDMVKIVEMAMLQGADQPQSAPQNIPENIPAMQIKTVADLYGISVPGGRTTTYSTDAAEASDCRVMGWSVQEYVKLERYQAAMLHGAENAESRCTIQTAPVLDSLPKIAESPSGNSPVIPDGWKLVPVELTGAMTNAMTDAILDDLHNVDVWRSVLAAAPQQEVKP